MLTARYLETVRGLVDHIQQTQLRAIEQAAEAVVEHIGETGRIFVFGAGHTSMMAQEVFYRAGGLAIVNPIFGPGVMLDERPVTLTTEMEHMEGFGRSLVRAKGVQREDALVVASISGRNPLPVDVALEGKEIGAVVVAVTSLAYSQSVEPLHSSRRRLFEVADFVLDCGAPPGDAALAVEGLPVKVGPVSTLGGALLMNLLMLQVIEGFLARGILPGIFASANLDWGREYNQQVLQRYRNRITYL